MSDLPCIKCGEPFDQAELHDWNEKTYAENLRAFQQEGCEGIGMRCNDAPNAGAASVASAMYDLLGDDIDCMDDVMAEAEMWGLI